MTMRKSSSRNPTTKLARASRRRPMLAAFAAMAAATALAGCVVVPARPVYYRPVPVRPYALVVY